MVARLLAPLAAAVLAASAARVEYDWTISNSKVKMDKATERLAVVVNGEYPMPVATAQLGDTLVLNIHNALDEPTGLHSHGILNNGTNFFDGAGMVTECGVAPGSRLAYEIPIRQTGTYWLHGHHNSQYINGLRGPLIVTDPEGEPYEYDEDVVLAFEDWFPRASTMKMDPEARRQQQQQMAADGPPDPSQKYPLAVINGINGADAPDINFTPGRTYRLRLLNMGSTSMFRFSIAGHTMHVIEADGVATERRRVDSVLLGVAQRVSVLVTARAAAAANFRYHLECFTDVFPRLAGFNPRRHVGSVVYGDALGYGEDGPAPWQDEGLEEFDDLALVPLEKAPAVRPDVVHELVVSADRTQSDLVQAFINGISFALPHVPSLFTALNGTGSSAAAGRALQPADFGRQCNAKILPHLAAVELRVLNTDSVFHPMHLHGHFFQIVERGRIGEPRSARVASGEPMRRDTILVGPGQYAVLRFVADNPGVWLMHCHIERHMELGLSMMFVSAPDVMRERFSVPDPVREHKLIYTEMLSQHDIAVDLEGLVVVAGPGALLPAGRKRRRQRQRQQQQQQAAVSSVVPRPVVETHDAAERLYTKNGLPLFEVLDKAGPGSCEASDAEQNEKEGPVAAVLRRRQRRQSSGRRSTGGAVPAVSHMADGGGAPREDLSDAYYRRLHRRPEYLEKRIRNRELELYQYARWRETQRRNAGRSSSSSSSEPAVGLAVPTAAAAASAATVAASEPKADAARVAAARKKDGGDKGGRAGKRGVRSNELRGLADSPGFARAREKATAAGGSVEPSSPGTAATVDGALGAGALDGPRVPELSPAERRAAHVGARVLEQLLVQAARLPPAGGSDHGDARGVAGPCCPAEFALPPRLFGHMMRQRELQQQQQDG
ncbi:ferroxidase fet3 [Coemansia erecta]|uniref:Ferroxidase fet3 n=1 Tax=Coemansia erecta TaxID=147472 RepID=A0A9W7XV92_9FUNG|nr:ferroxidase fet3 [Coemansia erecta]